VIFFYFVYVFDFNYFTTLVDLCVIQFNTFGIRFGNIWPFMMLFLFT